MLSWKNLKISNEELKSLEEKITKNLLNKIETLVTEKCKKFFQEIHRSVLEKPSVLNEWRFIVQPVKQYYAAKTKRSNAHMNYVTKQKLAATYIQNHLITEGNIATRRLRSDSWGLRVCSHQDEQ